MKNLKIKFLSFLVCFSLIISAQTETQIASELNKLGINSMFDVNTELARRGMSEADARKMAMVYGLDYDMYLEKYILNDENEPENNETNFTEISEVAELTYNLPIIDTVDAIDTLTVNDSLNNLPYFGYEIFNNNPFANKDYLIGNIDENYILGPGDEIRIYVWGAHAYQAQVRIDLNGNIALPENGVFFASGYTFSTLKNKLKNFLGKSYSGLRASPQTAFIDVSLTQLRPVSITVLGEANAPGPHLVNGFATVLNALYAAGGIKTSGSLREIKVYRNNKLLKTVDVYNYISAGRLDKDVRLMNNDVIFIPSRQSTIQLNGAVQKTAIYELKDDEGLSELLDFAGGLLPKASAKNISIHRIKPLEERTADQIFDRYLSTINWQKIIAEKNNFTLFDGDKITVYSILDQVLNEVIIGGSVNQPGSYSVSAYPDLKSLIQSAAKGIRPNTNTEKVDVYRTDLNGNKSFESLKLKEVLAGNQNLNLTQNDRVVVYGDLNVEGEEPYVEYFSFMKGADKTSNHVRKYWSENFSLYDLVFSLNPISDPNFKRMALYSRVDICRYNKDSGMYSILPFDLEDVIQKKDSIILMPFDQVHVYSKEVHEVVNKVVYIKGYVNSPGEFTLRENMTVEDLILLAGGFQEFADQKTVIVSSPEYNVDEGKISRSQEITVNKDYLLGNTVKPMTYNLQHLDVVNVRQIPGYEKMKSITVSGEVRYPGVVTLNNKRQSLKEVLRSVGGLSPFASIDASYILREGEPFIIDLGRMLRKNLSFLEDGDNIVIGDNSGDVSVQGAVLNEGLFVWEKGKRVANYINNSGGLDGKTESVVVELPNGFTKRKRWYNNPKVLPNSKVYVYAKPELEKLGNSEKWDKITNLVQVISSALTSAVVIQLIRQNN
tara:strand:+ start:486 stop:3158 length:2673 start_codon:yes stop_codon:yes gene_type:complete